MIGEDDPAREKDAERESLEQLSARRKQGWEQIREPSHQLREVSDHEVGPAPSVRTTGRGSQGLEFGTLVHRLFEHAVRGSLPDDERAYAIAQSACSPMPDRLIDEAMEALGYLRGSALWSELADSDAVYTEVPIAVTGEGAVVRGIIDLVYRLADGGWKIVDYKTDGVDVEPESIDGIRARYSAQVESYARYWERISGDPVIAKGLWSTQHGYVSV